MISLDRAGNVVPFLEQEVAAREIPSRRGKAKHGEDGKYQKQLPVVWEGIMGTLPGKWFKPQGSYE